MSIYRISSNTMSDNNMFHLKSREYSMDKVNEQINSGKKHRLPREGVTDVTQAMTIHTKLQKIEQYTRNINDAEGQRGLVENKMMMMIEYLQRSRELAVQGANGIYNGEDRQKMAVEIDQYLRGMVLEANTKYKGDYLFSGFQKFTKPFETMEGVVPGISESMIKEVKYFGDGGKQLREIDHGEYISATKPGNELFWAEQFAIYSSVNTKDFRLASDQSVMIDGVAIKFKAGDNAYTITEKINASPIAVNATIDPMTGGLVLKSTKPHKIEIADIEGGNVFRQLGILEEASGSDNYSQTASVYGSSIFDVMMGLRDSMLQNNSEDIGGRYLGAIDSAIENITNHLAETGALSKRMSNLNERLEGDKLSYTEILSKVEDVDISEAITDLKNLEIAHKASLASLARLSRASLLDYLR